MTVLLDVTCLCDSHTDEVLEDLHKAIGDPADETIWLPHPSPLLRRIVELFTQRGLERSAGMREELEKWVRGDMYRGREMAVKPAADGSMAQWNEAELRVTKLYLEHLPPAEFTLDDWMLLVDYLVHRYMGADETRAEADWLASRASIMGRVQAAMDAMPTAAQADTILEAVSAAPERLAAIELTPLQRAVLDFGRQRCCERVQGVTDSMRHRVRSIIVGWQEAVYLGDKAKTASALQTQLVDAFGNLNRDWRRIAVTEATNNLGNGLIASLAAGTRVKRVERYKGACPYCRSINGRILTVVDPAQEPKDGEKEVWVGKDNVGRSASPKRRVGGSLIDREPHEMYWIAAGSIHPNCQGGWVVLEQGKRPTDPKFSDWMDEVLGRKPQ